MEQLAEFDARIARTVGNGQNSTPFPPHPSGGLILIVEDDLANRRLVSSILKSIDMRTAEAADGFEACDFLKSNRPDAILLDVILPGIDGFEVCRRIKSHAATVNIPVLMISGLQHREMVYRSMASGADGFINKPFDTREVALKVRTALRTNRILRERPSIGIPKDFEVVKDVEALVQQRVSQLLSKVADTLSKVGRLENLPHELKIESDIATAATEKIASMTVGIREIEVLKSDLASVPFESVVLQTVLDEMLGILGNDGKVCNAVDPDISVICQRPILLQAFVKLAKYRMAQKRGGDGSVSITARREGDGVFVCVNDIGDADPQEKFDERPATGAVTSPNDEIDDEIENKLILAFCVAAISAQGGEVEVDRSDNSLFFALASGDAAL